MSAIANTLRRRSVKHGIGRLTASSDPVRLSKKNITRPAVTHLTEVAHKAPMRLIPVKKSSVHTAGAAVCALSNYGAGMLQGDTSELSVHVEPRAKLGLTTQGATRIYTQKVPTGECRTEMNVKVEKDGVFVYAPDPCTMFASSSYSQIQEFKIHPRSSVALIDWMSSGRFKNQERWEFDKLKLRTTLKWLDEIDDETEEPEKGELDGIEDESEKPEKTEYSNNGIPFLQDSLSLEFSRDKDPDEKEKQDPYAVADFNCFASLILYGEHMEAVKDRCQTLSDSFAAQYTRIREREEQDESETKLKQIDGFVDVNLAGRVVMGVSKVALPGKPNDAYVVRCCGKTNEDIYRVFHHCLKPVGPSFGYEFYKDRILAQRSEIPAEHAAVLQAESTEKVKDIDPTPPRPKTSPPTTSSSFWSIVMLADSGLPTGSFAHSAGLEAAAQLGMLQGEDDLRCFVRAATRSSMQQLAPFLVAGLRIAKSDGDTGMSTKDRWEKLHQECQAIMATNEPACSASIDQGKSLVRVASQWLSEDGCSQLGVVGGTENVGSVLGCLKNESPHVAPALGVVGGLLGLDDIEICRLFGYCMARDLVSSAVRLSLIGPLASVPLLHSIQESVEEGIDAVYHEIQEKPEDPLLVAATSAPIIETVHPCHEVLQTRLFRS